jgi:hypothetical protein
MLAYRLSKIQNSRWLRILFKTPLFLKRSTLSFFLVLVLSASADEGIDFNRDIRPILSENCFKCHGPDENKRKGGSRKTGRLRLDTQEGSRMDLGGYAAIVPANPRESELVYLVTAEDEDDRMPPSEEGRRLNDTEITLLKQWIEEGGNYAKHWSYQKPVRSIVPEIEADAFTLHNPIDHFIAKRLVAESLTQSPEADRYAMARRVALDLTGLPPSWDEVEAFVSDTKPKAYERYVEKQLNKTAYGEHWARQWLDLARYADSAGYSDDPSRTIWGFRDYVIRSFNENKPFDQFTIEQIAGDLLPNPTIDQLVATAFHRNTQTNSEGGTSDEEFRNVAVVDRVNTTMAVWMGTTMACAQCHTHKYDPISQEEYFQMFAILNNTADEDRKDEKPYVSLYTEAQEKEQAELKASLVLLKHELKAELSDVAHQERRRQWEKDLKAGAGWQVLRPAPDDMTANSKAAFTIDANGAIVVGDNGAPRDHYTINSAMPSGVSTVTGFKLEVLPLENPGSSESMINQHWVLNELDVRLINPKDEVAAEIVEEEADTEETEEAEEEEKEKKKIPKLKLTNASATFEQKWYVAKDVIDGNTGDRFTGWAVKGNLDAVNEAVFELVKPVQVPEGAKLQFKFYHNFPNKKIKRFRLSVTTLEKPMPAVSKELIPTLEKKVGRRTPQEEKALFDFFARFVPGSKAELAAIDEVQANLDAIKPLTTVPILSEVSDNEWRKTHIQHRGNFLDKGAEVKPGLPTAFLPLPKGAKADRLGLAKWLVDSENPLTARVVVNRYWEALFGLGIVSTSEDFGSQGELPWDQELLDWLAVELVESGWDLKHMIRLLVSSATYRQSSRVSPELYSRDPDNRFLARGPRFRVTAEMVRDQALAVSGLLSRKMYGPPVKPPQPEMGLTAAFGGKTDWTTSEGEDKLRRGLYTTWRRTNPYPSMMAFDAPNREFCTVRRDRTNTPLQALVTLNDPVYIEASQSLARRIAKVDGGPEEKAAYGFRQCLVRNPSARELASLTKLFHVTKQRYSKDPDSALKMATDPIGELPDQADAAEFAAWTVVGNALLNLDEMFLKR